ncbi:MAG: DUF3343 domain-containing protein [Faecousia sp.]
MDDYLIAVFQRPGDAALAQRDLTERSFRVCLMPSPRELSTSCGLSLRFSPQEADGVYIALRSLFAEPDRCRFFRACKEAGHRRFYPLICEACGIHS